MTNTNKRILTSFAMAALAGAAAWFGLVRWLAVATAVGMGIEVIRAKIKSEEKIKPVFYFLFLLYYLLFAASAHAIGGKPEVMLLLLMIIAAADTGAWFFGRKIKSGKMWERVSPNKTWAGQIAGIVCGTDACIMFGLLENGTFSARLMWIGIGVSLLSQYGDLAASAIKRKFGIKDFGSILPGHGGLTDRFDGWIFVLPIVWLAIQG
jgi:phosphatidate cytidylyltransferase